jgi:hypothetical protein
MFKAGIIAVAVCAAAAGTAFWFKTGFGAKSSGPVSTGMPPIRELHDKAHSKGLPVQEVPDPF